MKHTTGKIAGLVSLPAILLVVASAFAAEPMGERDFIRQVMGQPQEKVREIMGEPDTVKKDGKYEYWIYHNAVRDMISDKVFRQTQVLMVDGRVADSIHSQSEPEKTDE